LSKPELKRIGTIGEWKEVTVYGAITSEGLITVAEYREPIHLDGKLFLGDAQWFRLVWEPCDEKGEVEVPR